MAEYFETSEDAENYIRRASRPAVFYARIRLHGSEKWMVDHDSRHLGSSIVILEDLTETIGRIMRTNSTPDAPSNEHFRVCPNCGNTRSPYGSNATVNIFRCSCGQVYCDGCSGGGLIDLPRCPVSPYHEQIQKVGLVLAGGDQSSHTQREPAEPASPTTPSMPAVPPRPSLPPANEVVQPTGRMKAADVAEALRILFDRALPAMPQLPDERVRHFHNDWDGGSGGNLHSRSTERMRLLVAAHLQNLASQGGFEDFRIQADERWRCAFVEAFRATPRSVSFLLLWKKPGGELAAAATAAFPPSDDDVARTERWLADLAQPAASTTAQVEADPRDTASKYREKMGSSGKEFLIGLLIVVSFGIYWFFFR